MAIIQKIRDKYAKVAGGVIAVALIGFVINDAFNGKSGSIFGNSTSLAKVNGQKIDPRDYEQRVREYLTVYSISNNGKTVDDNVRAQINEQALRDMIYEKVIDQQLDKLGITITAKEEKELIYGTNPSPMVMQYPVFTNPDTHMFDPSRIKLYEQQMDQIDKTGKERENWTNFKSFVIHQYKLQKFNTLVSGSLYAPKFLAEFKMQNANEMASIRLVKVPNTVIPDNEVAVTDADINAYIEKNKARYQIDEAVRGIDYVAFDVVPSKEDTLTAQTALTKIKNELVSLPTTEIPSFVSRNSEEAYRDFYFTKKTFKSPYSDSILGKAEGTVFGPYIENSSYLLVKVLENKSMADSVKAQHILIQPHEGMDDSAAHKFADSLKLAIDKGASFDSIAHNFSADKQNSDKGGDLGYFAYGTMVPEFNDIAFSGKIGDIKVVKTQFGYHILRITDQKDFETATKLAIIVKALFPSDATETNIYTKATEFASKYNTTKGFEDGQKAMNVQKRIADNIQIHSFSIQGLGPSRELVRWVYDAKNGDVSGVIKLTAPNTRYIIAKLTNIQEKGTLKVNESSKPMIESIVKAEKKADKIAEKYKSQTSIDAIAQASGQTILTADSFTLSNAYLDKVGYEPKAIGYAFCKTNKENTLSPALKGKDGVAYMVVQSRVAKAVNPNEGMIFYQQQMMEQQQIQKNITNALQEMLVRKSNVKYYNDNIR
jgi:peptidyl-prolyl cis-trans isomerase D